MLIWLIFGFMFGLFGLFLIFGGVLTGPGSAIWIGAAVSALGFTTFIWGIRRIRHTSTQAEGYAHYIIKKGTLNVVIERERLESSLISLEIRFLLDLSEENVKEILRTGRTTVRNLLGGRKETVIMKGCNCQNMSSHQRGDATQFRM